jgi:HEAT repeat protein
MDGVERKIATAPIGAVGRTPSDVAALLVELGRVLKARQFYPAGDPALAELVDRGFRSVRAELERHGRLEVEVGAQGFRLLPDGAPIGRGRLDDLAQTFAARGQARFALDAQLDLPGFQTLVETLAGGPPATLPERTDRSAPRPRESTTVGAAAPSATTAAVRTMAATPGLAPSPAEKRSLDVDRAPLEAPPLDERGAHLVALLRELEACTDDARYAELGREVADDGAKAFDAGDHDESYRVLRVLGMHASDTKRRTPAQRETASQRLTELAVGPRLDALFRRACGRGAESSIRASQLLLQLGVKIVPNLLQRIDAEQDGDRRGQMSGILIAMGEKATPELVRVMEAGDGRRARTAARFAGEIQNPAAVATLRRLLQSSDDELRREAAKALVRIGHPSAVDALVEALGRRDPGLRSLAAYCLGATGSPRAFDAVREALPRALWRSDFELARELVRSLARFARPEAVAQLAAVLSRKSFLQRRALRDVKLAAIAALAKLRGEAALQALAQAAVSRDSELRAAAERELARRTPASDARPAADC